VLTCPGPQSALRTVEQHPEAIHLLLTDIVMPEMSGPTLAAEVRKARPEIRVLFISGFSSEAENALEAFGEDSLLSKPFTPTTLVAKVRELLTQRR
jgi:two-component system cell cycle sensor histidine kinase/response regulator CckA